MRRIREDYAHVALGARVVILWHGREKEGVVFHRLRGSGRLQVRLLDNNSTPQVRPERYVCTLVPNKVRKRPGARNSSATAASK
jgi:hypothetical protein